MEHVQLQLQTGFIDRLADNEVVTQRVTDGYFNATAMCRASGKLMGHYLSNSTTKSFLSELSSDIGIPISGLVQSVRGGDPHLQGTWVHPQVAINLAQWLSPKFAVLVSKWVFEWMSGNIRQPSLPYHLRKLGYPVDTYPKYLHRFEDGREVPARAYPNELIGELRRFFTEEWLRTRSEKYFADRDPKALPYLRTFLSLPNYREVMGYIEVQSEPS